VKRSGIYALRLKGTDRCYVGSAVDLHNRLTRHLKALREKRHCNVRLQNAWNAHGESSFEAIVLQFVDDKSCLVEAEQQWINKTTAYTFGFNGRPIANSNLGKKWSEEVNLKKGRIGHAVSDETKERIRNAVTGYRHSEETKAKMRKPKGKHSMPMSSEHRAKVSAARKGKPLSAEHRIKLSLAHIGIPQSAESRAKKSAALRGIKKSEETRKRMSLGQLARYI
jgi:group I intron endonuclease